MKWKYVKPLQSKDLIQKFEHLVGYRFPLAYKRCVLHHNGGRPERRGFDTVRCAGRELKAFLSFNYDDPETVWKAREWNKDMLCDKFIAFAIDNFGNQICFDTDNGHVVFLRSEDYLVEHVADSFSKFMYMLY